MVVAIYNVRALAVKGKNGYEHDECGLAKCQQLRCGFIGLQEKGYLGGHFFSHRWIFSRLLWAGGKRRQERIAWGWFGGEEVEYAVILSMPISWLRKGYCPCVSSEKAGWVKLPSSYHMHHQKLTRTQSSKRLFGKSWGT